MTPRPLLDIGPEPDEQLVAALLTTFDPADRDLLVDRLLPTLLGQAPVRADDTREFIRARAELCDALARLRGSIVVVSSSGIDTQMPWLHQYVSFHWTRTIQHAKLWMLHWRHESGAEHLELVVSSANLKNSGIDGQIQAAWRARVPLGRATQRNNKSWADLPHFLEQLNKSIGPSDSLQQFVDLLERGACPANTRFVATTPGSAGWGTASLKRALRALSISPQQMRVIVPTIGKWTYSSIQAWLKGSGAGDVTSLELAAVEYGSTVPESSSWCLPEATRDTLWDAAPNCLPVVGFGLLSEEVSKALRGGVSTVDDRRWSHAKLYEFRNGARSALLVTSANFTSTAWDTNGKGNFELGVLIDGAELPFQAPLARRRDQVLARGAPMVEVAGLWGSAEWDGHRITVYTLNLPSIQVALPIPHRQRIFIEGRLRKVVVEHREAPPAFATVTQTEQSIQVPIVDVRSVPDDLPIAELSAEACQEWRDQLLLERYGYTPEPGEPRPHQKRVGNDGEKGREEDYSVSMLSEARRYFNYVDGWQAQFDGGKRRPQVVADGRKLLELVRRHRARPNLIPEVLDAVADELALRLELAACAH